MRITFFIEYHTRWGQQLLLSGDAESLGSNREEHALPMQYVDDGWWTATVDIDPNRTFTYRYLLREDGVISRKEWGGEHCFRPTLGISDYQVYDEWRDIAQDRAFLSSAVQQCGLLRRENQAREVDEDVAGVRFEVTAPALLPHETLAVVGSFTRQPWSVEEACLMSDARYPVWSVTFPSEILRLPVEYKFVVVDKSTHHIVAWEEGANRRLPLWVGRPGETIVAAAAHLRLSRPLWKGAGVAIPVFSLRSESSWGIGEFLDIEKMVDWAVLTGQRLIQILPVNDTTMWHTWLDSYPYRANSVYALHPAYLHLPAVGRLTDDTLMATYEQRAAELNALPAVDYEAVVGLKDEYVRQLFAEVGTQTLATPEYRQFFADNKAWLVPYAAFCYLRDTRHTPVWPQWGEYAVYDPEKIARLTSEDSDAYLSVARYYFEQYHLHRQLSHVRDYARSRGVVVKGDLPIGVSHESVDAWVNPQLFHLSMCAGAPPDDFSITGQNWGFPTYNWQEMAKDGYSWWKARFTKMAEYFDAYRIDHILGFFRIWEIPETAVEGLPGHFNAALPFTADELARYGFPFDEERHARPYIHPEMLPELFGDYVQEVCDSYLLRNDDGTFRLKEIVDNQKKIAALFDGVCDERAQTIRRGLFCLTDEVLFVSDPYAPHTWHPRIMAYETYSFKALTPEMQENFRQLHDDFYYSRHNDFWREEAMKKLPTLLSSTQMLVCGEDLGMIPQCVPDVMEHLQILSLEIERMPKEWGREFGDTSRYPYLSVCTTSTHDMSGIRGWWEEEPSRTQRYYNTVLQREGVPPEQCPPYICEEIIRRHLASPSMWVILPLQDWLSICLDIRVPDPSVERINVPSDPRNYWRYRMHLTLESLIGQERLNTKIKTMIAQSSRD